MPAVSKKQQKFFGMVYAHQKGKLPTDKVSATIKKVAKSISPEEARRYATTKHIGLQELQEIATRPIFIEETLRSIVEDNTPDIVKGELLDVYTSRMILTLVNKLNENNKNELLSKSVNEMVALSYTMLTS